MKVLSDILHKAGVLKENAEAYSSGGYSVLVRNDSTQRIETVPSVSLLPSQSGNSGKFLTTNGTTASWATVPPDTLDSVTTAGNTTANSITVGNVTATSYSIASTFWAGLAYKNNNNGNMSMTFSGNDILFTAGPSAPNEVIRIYGTTQNVGINTGGVDAGYKFDVNGTSRFSGNITLSNFANIVTTNQFYGLTTNYANSIFVGWDASAVYLGYSMGSLPIHLGSNGSGQVWFRTTGSTKIDSLAGVGSRMVTVDSSGVLSTQSIPTGNITGTGSAGQVTYWTGASTQSGSNNLFWDNTNGRLGVNTNAPTQSVDVSGNIKLSNQSQLMWRNAANNGDIPIVQLTNANVLNIGTTSSSVPDQIRLHTNSVERARLFNNGNLLLQSGGTFTDGGQRLQVQGDAFIKGSGNTSGTFALLVENSDAVDIFTIANNGYTRYGNLGTSAFRVYPSSASTSGDVDLSNGEFLTLNSRSGATQTGTSAGFVHINGVVSTGTAGIQNVLCIQKGFAPTSGNAEFRTLISNPNINQTGGANGITRGLYVNPTLTAAADWRSIEWSNNTGWGLYGAGSAPSYHAGAIGIGTTGVDSTSAFNLRVSRQFSGGTVGRGIVSDSQVTAGPSTIVYFSSNASASATASVNNLRNFYVSQGTFTAGASITTQTGFDVDASMVGATNNYAFKGGLPAGTGRWNLYMDGTADNYLAGALGIGATVLTGYTLRLSKTLTGATTSIGVYQNGVVQSDATGAGQGFRNDLNTAAAAFTVGSYVHYQAHQGTIGAGSTVTNQIGFAAGNTMTGGTNIFGFYGDIPSGTNRWNLYCNGTAPNFMSGSLGIGTTSLTGYNLRVSKPITGATISGSIFQAGTVESDVTNNAIGYSNQLNTRVATFTLSNYSHYYAEQGTIGAGSIITNQYGFRIDSSLTGATNNYGFFGNIPAQANAWNLYCNGTANNYMAGSLGVGSTSLTGYNLRIEKNHTGSTTSFGVLSGGSIQSDVVTANYFQTFASVQNTAFTLSNLRHYYAAGNSSFGSATVTNQFGFIADSALTGATNNYGFYGNIASGTGRWNFFANGTAANYLNGNTIIGGSAVDGGQKLQVNGDTLMKGSGNTSGTFALTVQNSDGTNILRLRNDNGIFFGNAINFGAANNSLTPVDPTTGLLNITSSGTGIRIGDNVGTTTTGYQLFVTSPSTTDRQYTSGEGGILHLGGAISFNRAFSPTSGTGTFNAFKLSYTINQTGGANGITRGLYVNPTLTAAADWRSIETSNNSGWSYYGAGTAASYFGGDVEIGTTTGVRRLNIFSSTGDTHVAVLGTAPSVSLSDTATGATYQAKFGLATSANNFVTGSAAGDFVISNQAGNTIWAYNSVEGMRFTVNRNLLLGGTSDSGKKLQVTGEVNVTSGNATSIEISNTAGNYHLLMSSVSVAAAYGMYISGSDMLFTKTGAASPNITIKSTNGDVVFGNTIKTAAPTGGTSQAWKLGQYNATAPTATGYVEVEVNGVLYKLLAST